MLVKRSDCVFFSAAGVHAVHLLWTHWSVVVGVCVWARHLWIGPLAILPFSCTVGHIVCATTLHESSMTPPCCACSHRSCSCSVYLPWSTAITLQNDFKTVLLQLLHTSGYECTESHLASSASELFFFYFQLTLSQDVSDTALWAFVCAMNLQNLFVRCWAWFRSSCALATCRTVLFINRG